MMESNGLDQDKYWIKQAHKIQNLKKVMNSMYHQQIDGQKRLVNFKKNVHYKNTQEYNEQKLAYLNK